MIVRVTDSCLRDGSHTVGHQFTVAHVRSIAGMLAESGVPVIEVAHGDGLGGSSFNYGFSAVRRGRADRRRGCERAGVDRRRALDSGIGIVANLEAVAELGVGMVRVATHCTEADISAQHIAFGRSLGLEVVGFLMMSHMQEPAALAEQARLMEAYGAHTVYVVDSAGALVPRRRQIARSGASRALDPEPTSASTRTTISGQPLQTRSRRSMRCQPG